MNDFARDDEWQREQRDRIIAPVFYGKYAKQGRYVTIDKGRLATILQKRYAVDTIVQGKDGSALCIEEKIVRWPGYRYAHFFLETKSCTIPGHESPGWMFYGEADFLLYCFQCEDENCFDCWLIDFPKLQEWFWPRQASFKTHRMKENNQTEGCLVPVMDVHRAMPTWRKMVRATPGNELDEAAE